MLTIRFQYIALVEIMYVAGIPEMSKTFNKKALDFGKGFLNFLWKIIWFFFFQCENMLGYFDGLSYTEPSLPPWMEPISSLWRIFLMYSWIHFANIFWVVLHHHS